MFDHVQIFGFVKVESLENKKQVPLFPRKII